MPTDKQRKRIVVEEVGAEAPATDVKPQEELVSSTAPEVKEAEPEALGEVLEKVEELKDITETIAEEVDKSVEVQEELAEAAEKVAPAMASENAEMGPPQPLPQSKMPNLLFVLIPGVLILGAILGGIYFYQKSTSGAIPTETPVATVSPDASTEPTPSASPSGKLDLTKYPINVQNGVGIPGTAGTAKDILVKAGFKVSAAGNADNYDYTDTVVKVKSTVPAEFVTKLNTALSAKYKLAKTGSLPDSSKDDVVVIIGNTKP